MLDERYGCEKVLVRKGGFAEGPRYNGGERRVVVWNGGILESTSKGGFSSII